MRERPELDLGLGLYLTAFRRLTTCRIYAMGPGPIPWSAVDEYADRLGLDPEQRDALHYHVRAMDQVYLRHCEKEQVRASKQRA